MPDFWNKLRSDYYNAEYTTFDYDEYKKELISKLNSLCVTKAVYDTQFQEIKEHLKELKATHNKQYREKQGALEDEFRKDAEEEFSFWHLPEKVKSSLHQLAYEEGHAYGFSEIASQYYDLVDLALLCFEEARKSNG